MSAVYIISSNFFKNVNNRLEIPQKRPTIILVKANYCPVCVNFLPVYHKLYQKYRNNFVFCQIELIYKDNKKIRELFKTCGINLDSVPFLLVFKNGKLVSTYDKFFDFQSVENYLKSIR
jgi:thiol-disulfide isomerase/thioredoxin